MSRIVKSDANAALDRVVANLKKAAGADGITSRADVKTALPSIASPTERALTDRFFRFVDHRDARPNARVTGSDLDSAAAYAKEHLLAKYDVKPQNGFSKAEIAKMSMTGQLAVKLAQELKGVTPIDPNDTPASALGRTITAAAKDCDYMSESDSTPAYVEPDKSAPAGDVIAQYAPLLQKALDFGDGVDLSTLAVEKQGDAEGFLHDMTVPYDPSDEFITKNAAAWQTLSDVLHANLHDFELYKVGPKDDDGSLAQDRGSYEYILVGKTADDKTAGVAFESVET